MFYTLTLENETGQQIDLSKTANRFMFSKIEGLNPPAGTVSTSSYAGATCGKWGMCGSASSVGAALAIIHETGPLSSNEYYKHNLQLVSNVLLKVSEIGGPRCCKRNGFLAIKTAAEFVSKTYGIDLECDNFSCDFSNKNAQCIKTRCPFYRRTE